MNKFYTLFFTLNLWIFFFENYLQAAPISYTFSAVAGTYTANASPNVIMGGGTDSQMSGPIPIGFTFYFNCTAYTDFLVSDNGWMTFDPNCWDFHGVNNLSTTGSNDVDRPIIAPLWDDLSVDNVGDINYKLTGGAGSRILTVEWRLMIWYWSGVAGSISFQTKLFEGTNKIEFVYKQEAGALAAGRGASIGLGGSNTGDYYTLNGTGGAPTASKATNTTNLTTRPANGQIYRWVPTCVVSLPIELSSFTGKSMERANLLEWSTTSENNNDFFALEKSLNGTDFSVLSYIKGAGSSNQNVEYSFLDDDPAEISYYRLRQTDFDGVNIYHQTIPVYKNQLDLLFYPNPASDFIFFNGYKGSFTLFNTAGTLILSGNLDENKSMLDISTLDEGMYFLKINDSNLRKITIRH